MGGRKEMFSGPLFFDFHVKGAVSEVACFLHSRPCWPFPLLLRKVKPPPRPIFLDGGRDRDSISRRQRRVAPDRLRTHRATFNGPKATIRIRSSSLGPQLR